MARWRSLSDRVNTAVIFLCILFVSIMLAISFAGSAYMIATGDSLSWTYSLARLFVPWIGLLSSTVALRYGEHIAMTLLTRNIPSSWATAMSWVVLASIAILGLLLVETGWQFFLNSTQYYMVSDQIQVHHRWVAASVPVTGLVILVHLGHGHALLENASEAELEEALDEAIEEARQ